MKSSQFLSSQNRLHNSVECWLPSVDSKIKAELPDGAWHHLKVPNRPKFLSATEPGLCISFHIFFNIYCILKNRNTCLCQSLHGIPDEKPLKEKKNMQFESKCVKLPRHTQPEALGSSWEDADSPPWRDRRICCWEGFHCHPSLTSPLPLLCFSRSFPTLGFALNEKGLWRWLQ